MPRSNLKPIWLTVDMQCLSTIALDEIISGYVAAEENGYITKGEMTPIIEECRRQYNVLTRVPFTGK